MRWLGNNGGVGELKLAEERERHKEQGSKGKSHVKKNGKLGELRSRSFHKKGKNR